MFIHILSKLLSSTPMGQTLGFPQDLGSLGLDTAALSWGLGIATKPRHRATLRKYTVNKLQSSRPPSIPIQVQSRIMCYPHPIVGA